MQRRMILSARARVMVRVSSEVLLSVAATECVSKRRPPSV
jgi:hypothetical protein